MPKTIVDIYKQILEQKLSERQIAWSRKDKGLQLALFGRPQIRITEEAISIGFSETNSTEYQYLEICHGELANPNCDPEATIEKILSIVDTINALMDEATNVEEIANMRRVILPSSTVRSLVSKGLKARGVDIGFTSATWRVDGYMIRHDKDKSYKVHIDALFKDGTGQIYSNPYTDQPPIPLDQALDVATKKIAEYTLKLEE